MSKLSRFAIILSSTTALAQPATDPAAGEPASPTDPNASTTAETTPEADTPKKPERGDFDAGGKVRLPNGPDESNQYATFNWIALDVFGRYFILDTVTVNANVPLAVKTPDLMTEDPELFGGFSLRLDAFLPDAKKLPLLELETELGVSLTTAYLREGAMLLSEKDYPKYVGDLKPGLAAAIVAKVKLSSLLDFSLLPAFVFQSGTSENLTAIQIPMALIVKLGSLLEVSTELGVFTGDDISLRAKNGGRIYAGAAVDVKLGPIILHAGGGVASLFTDAMGLYPSLGDSVYIDLNVKYAK